MYKDKFEPTCPFEWNPLSLFINVFSICQPDASKWPRLQGHSFGVGAYQAIFLIGLF